MLKIDERELLMIIAFFLKGAEERIAALATETESETLRCRLRWLSGQLAEDARASLHLRRGRTAACGR